MISGKSKGPLLPSFLLVDSALHTLRTHTRRGEHVWSVAGAVSFSDRAQRTDDGQVKQKAAELLTITLMGDTAPRGF